MKKTVAIVEAPIGYGQKKGGVEKAPQFFYEKQFHKLFENCDLIRMKTQSYHELYKTALEVLRSYSLCVFLGGDHSISLSTISAFSQTHSKRCVLWLDAHGDINTPETSLSGNLHGMPLAGLLGLFKPHKTYSHHFFWFQGPYLSPSEVILLGIRNLDKEERVFLKTKNIHWLSYKTVKQRGLIETLQPVLELVNKDKTPLHLSFDIDVVNPKLAPATGTPVKEGFDLKDIQELMKFLKKRKELVSMDLSEFNPCLGHSKDLQNQTYSFFEEGLKTYISN